MCYYGYNFIGYFYTGWLFFSNMKKLVVEGILKGIEFFKGVLIFIIVV